MKTYEPRHGNTSSALAFLDYGCVGAVVGVVVGVVVEVVVAVVVVMVVVGKSAPPL